MKKRRSIDAQNIVVKSYVANRSGMVDCKNKRKRGGAKASKA
jgi:hypothetical protein